MNEGDPYWYMGHRVTLVYASGDRARITYDETGKTSMVRKTALRFRHEYVAEVEPAPEPPRTITTSARRGRPSPKSKPVRSRVYMDFVKGHRCCVCQAPPPSDPHHFGPAGTKGMGMKTDDLRTVPLCRRCHDEFHAKATVRGMTVEETETEFYKAQVALLVKWFVERENA